MFATLQSPQHVVALLCIPVVQGEAGTDANHRFCFPFFFVTDPVSLRSPPPVSTLPSPPHSPLPSQSHQISLHSPPISVSVNCSLSILMSAPHQLLVILSLKPSSSILRLSILFTPINLITQLFSQTCSFSCCFSVVTMVSRPYR